MAPCACCVANSSFMQSENCLSGFLDLSFVFWYQIFFKFFDQNKSYIICVTCAPALSTLASCFNDGPRQSSKSFLAPSIPKENKPSPRVCRGKGGGECRLCGLSVAHVCCQLSSQEVEDGKTRANGRLPVGMYSIVKGWPGPFPNS